jgi:hypothetical protein
VLQQFESRPPDMVAAAQWTDINQLIEQIVAESDVRTFRSRAITTELHLDSALPPLHLPLAVMRDIMSALLSVSAEQCGSTGRIAVSSADGVNWNGRPVRRNPRARLRSRHGRGAGRRAVRTAQRWRAGRATRWRMHSNRRSPSAVRCRARVRWGRAPCFSCCCRARRAARERVRRAAVRL